MQSNGVALKGRPGRSTDPPGLDGVAINVRRMAEVDGAGYEAAARPGVSDWAAEIPPATARHSVLDDLHFPDGDDPGHITGWCRRQVRDWRFAAVGRRPEDWLGRDATIGALMRDRRPRLMRKFAASPPKWAQKRVARLPDQARQQAVQITALHYRHLLRLAWLLADARHDPEGGPEGDRCRLLRDLSRCPPAGAAVLWDGPGVRGPRDVCRHARLCPWCHARLVTRLHDRLGRRLAHSPGNTYLVLTMASVVGALTPDRVGHAKDLGRRMRDALVEKGVTGGITTYRVGPHRDANGRGGYRHEVAVLGQIRLASDRDRHTFEGHMRGRGQRTCVHVGVAPDLHRVTWGLAPAQNPRALRLFLAGSGPRFHCPDDLVVCQDDRKGRSFRDGFPGALSL